MAKNSDDFWRRLRQACDNNSAVPSHGEGRYLWLSQKMEQSREGVRKWFQAPPEGSRPRLPTMQKLAKLLNVDYVWLMTGTGVIHAPKEERAAHAKRAEANIYLLYGMFLAAGGQCAFPKASDPNSEHVDFYSILRGQQSAIRACPVRETEAGKFEIAVPSEYKKVRCIAVMPAGAFHYQLIQLPPTLIDENKPKLAGDFLVQVRRDRSDYYLGKALLPRLRSDKDL